MPYDRPAAEKLRLPFYEGPAAGTGEQSPRPGKADAAVLRKRNLRDDLASLKFDEIKIRTFRGAMRRVLDPRHGLPAYLDAIRAASGEFSAAAAAPSAKEMTRIAWPSLPAGVLVDENPRVVGRGREPWSRRAPSLSGGGTRKFYGLSGPRGTL